MGRLRLPRRRFGLLEARRARSGPSVAMGCDATLREESAKPLSEAPQLLIFNLSQ